MTAMTRFVSFVYRLAAGASFGAQLFFAAVAAQAIFTAEVAALPRDDPRRAAAADLVGLLLAHLDRLTLTLAGTGALAAIALARLGVANARRAAVPMLLTGLLALASSAWVTPQIHALRLAGETGTPAFGRLHGLSGLLLLLELAALASALWIAPRDRLPADGAAPRPPLPG